MQWRRIHHNFFIDNYSPQEGVDNDDGSSYYKTHVSRLLEVSGVWVPKEEVKDALCAFLQFVYLRVDLYLAGIITKLCSDVNTRSY